VVTKRLKRLVPAPLRRPMRGAAPFLIPPLQRRLTRTWRRRNRLKRGIGRVRKRLNRLWRKQLKPIPLHIRLLIWNWRRRNRPAEPSDQIHLINPLLNYTGAPLRTLHLYDELKDRAEVCLWSEHKVPLEIAQKYTVRQIVSGRFEFPDAGTFVIVSPQSLGPWIRYARPRRTILVHNSSRLTPREFRRRLRHISKGGRRKVEIVYASELTKRKAGNYPGYVEPSLIDIDKFVPASKKPSDSASAGFTVGRLSSDLPHKHHPDDAALYRRLVEEGCRIRIMGPSPSLEAELGGLKSVVLLPVDAQEAHLFLQGLDCFFYRTSEEYLEAWGRVVTEAMACGLPVVCHNRGGYTKIIDHGRNGFLFKTQQEALEILLLLKEDPALRERVGREARRTAEGLFSPARRSEIVDFYLR
jgi:glycosyltransferase involved in cell wall biosynthesis